MDLQELVDSTIKKNRALVMEDSDQITLGEIIAKMRPIVAKQAGRKEEAYVVYDFGYMHPTYIDSWRGIYAELALDYSSETGGGENDALTATDFLKMLEGAVGKTYTGYKGGEFTMSESTPVWVSNYGEACNTAVLDIFDDGWQVVIMTGYRDT